MANDQPFRVAIGGDPCKSSVEFFQPPGLLPSIDRGAFGGAPGVLRPLVMQSRIKCPNRLTTSGCCSKRSVFSAESATQSNSWKRGQPSVLSLPGRAQLQPPESGQRVSFQRPCRRPNEPLIELSTSVSREAGSFGGGGFRLLSGRPFSFFADSGSGKAAVVFCGKPHPAVQTRPGRSVDNQSCQ